MEHTPVPWKIVGKDTDPWTIAPADWQRSGDDTIAEITYTGADAEANAAYIVRACNNFEDLLAALKSMLGDRSCGHSFTCNCAEVQARAAIAKTEEGR